MADGTPRSLDEVEPYYTDIRRGRKPSEELLQELIERYRLVGGGTPLSRYPKLRLPAYSARWEATIAYSGYEALASLYQADNRRNAGCRHL